MARYCHECGTALHNDSRPDPVVRVDTTQTKKKKTRKVSAYSQRYGREFRRVAPKYKTKSGAWKKDGFKRAQAAAHKATKRAMK